MLCFDKPIADYFARVTDVIIDALDLKSFGFAHA